MKLNEDIWRVRLPYKDCGAKLKFNTYSEAEEALEKYNERIPLNTMEIYLCPKHNIYHHGHSRRYPKGFFDRIFKKNN
tara:strand:- start:5821 stop:6054 length:234 start_codon:yes stop_codon:yes gene_type:complete